MRKVTLSMKKLVKLSIWDFLKVHRLEHLAMSKDKKIAAIKKYVHAMKNLDTGLNGEFISDY